MINFDNIFYFVSSQLPLAALIFQINQFVLIIDKVELFVYGSRQWPSDVSSRHQVSPRGDTLKWQEGIYKIIEYY